jgi:hypothetical protein
VDAIFGDGALNELLTYQNGLFLHPHIEDALIKKGLLFTVPDVWCLTTIAPELGMCGGHSCLQYTRHQSDRSKMRIIISEKEVIKGTQLGHCMSIHDQKPSGCIRRGQADG